MYSAEHRDAATLQVQWWHLSTTGAILQLSHLPEVFRRDFSAILPWQMLCLQEQPLSKLSQEAFSLFRAGNLGLSKHSSHQTTSISVKMHGYPQNAKKKKAYKGTSKCLVHNICNVIITELQVASQPRCFLLFLMICEQRMRNFSFILKVWSPSQWAEHQKVAVPLNPRPSHPQHDLK